ncbi:hypothetical protein GBA52_028860 [Prunus armeniaca]|nr:hypothetical protein GBA52_028860 [Prunus armeniaca]
MASKLKVEELQINWPNVVSPPPKQTHSATDNNRYLPLLGRRDFDQLLILEFSQVQRLEAAFCQEKQATHRRK